jgi:hypothetical protein
MLSPEEIAEQQQLLATYRRTLAIYLKQRAEIGHAYSPPAVINGIDDTRSHIRRIKATLSAAGVAVPRDPDDDETQTFFRRPVAVPAQGPLFLRWLWPMLTGILAIVLAVGAAWWLLPSLPSATPSQQETPSIPEETPSAEASEAPTDNIAETPSTEIDPAELERQLTSANMALSEVQVDKVREYINDPNTGYKLLAEHALQVVGDQKFRDTLYLDELDVRYTELVGEEHYAEFNEERLKEAMVRAWNEHYTDKQVGSFDEIVEPRS